MTDTASQSPSQTPYTVLVISVMAATFATIFIKLAQNAGMPSLLIAAGRMVLASLILSPLVLYRYRDELRQLQRRDLLIALFGGFWLAVHFIFLVLALARLPVIIAIVILNTGPIWVALLEKLFLKATINRFVWIGMAVAFAGGLIIAIAGNTGTSFVQYDNILFGSLLAVCASVAGSAYLVIGRSIRRKFSLFPYVWIVFGVGGLVASLAVIGTRTPIVGLPTPSYLWLLMLTLIPQLIGHSGFNYVVKYFPATVLAIVNQSLTVTSSIVAFFVFDEVPGLIEIIGSVIVVIGVIVTIYAPYLARKRKP